MSAGPPPTVPPPAPPPEAPAPGAAPQHPPASWRVLAGLVIAQAFGISPWLTSSGVLPAIAADWHLAPKDGGLLVSAVQAGFIAGTLGFALLNVADLFAPRRVFFWSALATAAGNAGFALSGGLGPALAFRFVTGVALAGVYPVGLKLAVSWYPQRAGYVLSWMLAAGALGSSSAYLLAGLGSAAPWPWVVGLASALAVVAGAMVLRIGEGPHLPPAQRLELAMSWRLFRIRPFRASSLGYLGHMWEFYAAWGLAPLYVTLALAPLGWADPQWVRLGAFAMVVAGVPGCLVAGLLSLRWGSLPVAVAALAGSGLFCLLGPVLYRLHPLAFGAGLLAWGVLIIADSAQIFALASAACPPRYVGTALTVQNCIGFALSIASIELASRLFGALGPDVLWLLAPGPALGVYALLHGGRDPTRQSAAAQARA